MPRALLEGVFLMSQVILSRRARISGSKTVAALNSRLESNKEEEKKWDGTAWIRTRSTFGPVGCQ
jgi:hypothetical protein